tara:strand:- start:2279 stop:3052 length:774 start_codon:yes stop_codon:yes gene_type:complete
MIKKNKSVNVYKTDYYIDKYLNNRHHHNELFESEKYFIPRILKKNINILDVGCACGGFYNILKTFEPTINYYGVDISESLIMKASELYPKGNFSIYDTDKKKIKMDYYDLIQSWGVMLHEPKYKELIKELWYSTKESLVFDIRGQIDVPEVINKNESFVLNPGGIKNYYITVNLIDFIKYIFSLNPKPNFVEIFGYLGNPNKYTTLPESIKNVYMISLLISKNKINKNQNKILLNVPDALSKILYKKFSEEKGLILN